jgi:hypothetical protein
LPHYLTDETINRKVKKMNTQVLIWLAAGAAGILVFKFVSLGCWDLLKYCPTPWESHSSNEWDANKHQESMWWYFKFWTFLFGCLLAFFAVAMCHDASRPDLIVWVLLGGFATPAVAIFLLRVLFTIISIISKLYAQTEVIYKMCKTGIVKHLRKKGRIE